VRGDVVVELGLDVRVLHVDSAPVAPTDGDTGTEPPYVMRLAEFCPELSMYWARTPPMSLVEPLWLARYWKNAGSPAFGSVYVLLTSAPHGTRITFIEWATGPP
jgi:hypothetical protein